MAWLPTPRFNSGRVISAAGHINPLITDTDFLYGSLVSNQVACGGYFDSYADTPIWRGALKHRHDNVLVRLHINSSGSNALTITTRAVGTSTISRVDVVSASFNGDITLTALNVSTLEERELYFIEVEITSGSLDDYEVYILTVYEYRASGDLSFPSLHTFASGTPAASDWNNLSTTADLLKTQFNNSMNGFSGTSWTPNHASDLTDEIDVGQSAGIFHVTDNLAVDIAYYEPNGADNNRPYLFVHVYINDVLWKTVGTGAIDGTVAIDSTTLTVQNDPEKVDLDLPQGTYFQEGDYIVTRTHDRFPDESEVIKLGPRDGNTFNNCSRAQYGTSARAYTHNTMINSYQGLEQPSPFSKSNVHRFILQGSIASFGLSVGSVYRITIKAEYDRFEGNAGTPLDGKIYLDGVWEYLDPGATPTLAGYEAMSPYEHKDTVAGTDGIKILRDNLEFLKGEVDYRSIATHGTFASKGYAQSEIFTYRSIQLVRKHDWLWYYIENEEDDPQIRYYWQGWQTVGLTTNTEQWQLYDLSKVEGLWSGTSYFVDGVTFALEDYDSCTEADN